MQLAEKIDKHQRRQLEQPELESVGQNNQRKAPTMSSEFRANSWSRDEQSSLEPQLEVGMHLETLLASSC